MARALLHIQLVTYGTGRVLCGSQTPFSIGIGAGMAAGA